MGNLVFTVLFEGYSLPLTADSLGDVEIAATIPAKDISYTVGDSPPVSPRGPWIDVLEWAADEGHRLVVQQYKAHCPSVGTHTHIVRVVRVA